MVWGLNALAPRVSKNLIQPLMYLTLNNQIIARIIKRAYTK